MKKIGLLSFPTAINHGAYLQIYALKVKVEELGHSVRILNYRNETHYRNEIKSLFFKKNPLEILYNIKRFLKFKRAQKRFHMSKLVHKSDDMKTNDLDIISIGADIVWNYETNFLGHDSIYFGKGLNSKRIISYAPSMGDSTYEKVPKYVTDNLSLFSHKSARDNNTKSIVESLSGSCELVLDPTLIVNWKDHEINTFNFDFKYILIYAFAMTDNDINAITAYAKKYDLKIVSICFNKKYSWCDVNIISIDPLEFLYVYKNSEFVFTSTFHGFLFSLKYNKNFVLRDNKTVHNKVVTLVEQLHLYDRLLSTDLSTSEILSLMDAEMDYKKINKELNLLIDKSVNYLKGAINA